MMKNIKWNKEFYERCKDVFQIQVYFWVEEEYYNTTQNATSSSCISSSKTSYSIPLDLGGFWKVSENGKYLEILDEKGNTRKYITSRIYLSIPEEVSEIFDDLVPWIAPSSYNITMTTSYSYYGK